MVQLDEGGIDEVHFMAVTASRYYAPVALGIWCANWELSCEALGEAGVFEPVVTDTDALPRHDVTWRAAS